MHGNVENKVDVRGTFHHTEVVNVKIGIQILDYFFHFLFVLVQFRIAYHNGVEVRYQSDVGVLRKVPFDTVHKVVACKHVLGGVNFYVHACIVLVWSVIVNVEVVNSVHAGETFYASVDFLYQFVIGGFAQQLIYRTFKNFYSRNGNHHGNGNAHHSV